MTALLDAYRARLAAGEIKADPAQAFAVEKLETLTRALGAYKPDPRPGFWRASLGFARKFGTEQRGAPLRRDPQEVEPAVFAEPRAVVA